MTDIAAPVPPAPLPTLLTPRLRLRPLRRSDAGLIALHCGDIRVARMTERIPHPYPPGLAEAMIERLSSGRAEETAWALDSGSDGENGLVGIIALRPEAPTVGRIGYWVAPAVWGAGYAGEAVEAVKAWAPTAALGALKARVFQDNLASVRVLTRAGFAYEGNGEVYSVARAGMVPVFRYGLELAA